MDKAWVVFDRRSNTFTNGLQNFITHASEVASFDGNIKCPCKGCQNRFWKAPQIVKEHLMFKGMDLAYVSAIWKHHGEPMPTCPVVDTVPLDDSDMHAMCGDAFGIHGIGTTTNEDETNEPLPQSSTYIDKFYNLLADAETELYPGCGRTKLSFLVQLYQVKCMHRWSDISFTKLLDILRIWMPTGVNLPSSFYNTKKLISELGLTYEKIDACEKDCMLYWQEHATATSCIVCGANRYKEHTTEASRSKSKRNKIPNKVLRYFPLGPRLQRLYMCRHTSELMTWHANGRSQDGVLRHPADSPAWCKLDNTFPEFSVDARNVRLGLASDGFNPFGMMSISHSTWPVVMSVYNLPPWLCMKQPYLLLSLLIPGPKSPVNDIDVYLQPLVEELKTLWNVGIPTFDSFKKEMFILKAAVLWTINDFSAYAMLSGWSTKGKKACPHCAFNTDSLRLQHGKKECYLGHRRWLPQEHRFRIMTRSFDGHVEIRSRPIPMTGAECLASLRGLTFQFGKGHKKPTKRNREGAASPWKKRSIFFDLPYWEFLLLRHNLDVMHIEKNVTDSVLGTLLALEGKNKDSLAARLDLMSLNMKPNFHPQVVGNRTILPPLPFTLSTAEKTELCKILASVRLPDGFSSNVSRCVRVNERKLVGLKSHDCHIIMQILLPIAIRHALPREVVRVLLELSSFFRNLCTKVGDAEHFQSLGCRIAIVLCQLEKILPPAFFDIMVHLPIHLAEEAAIAGPVHYRWMYPIERYLGTLKKYVRNKARPEGCIAEGYIVEECLSFCELYFGDKMLTRRNMPGRNADAEGANMHALLPIFSQPGRSLGAVETVHLGQDELDRAHRYILFNCCLVKPYIRIHEDHAKAHRKGRVTVKETIRRAHLAFSEWFRKQIETQLRDGIEDISDDLRALAKGPSQWARRWKAYVMNGYRFRVKTVEESETISQNSGVYVYSESDDFATARDPNPRTAMGDYYGVLRDIIELDYFNGRKVILFDCDWVDSKSPRSPGLKIDEYGFTLVNFGRLLPPPDTFVLGSQVQQVFYVKDPADPDWQVAVRTRPRDLFDLGNCNDVDISLPQRLDDATSDADEIHARSDIDGIVVSTV